jgi:hypothetical protein
MQITLVVVCVMTSLVSHQLELRSRDEFILKLEISNEKKKFESLITNLLPRPVLMEIRRNGRVDMKPYSSVSGATTIVEGERSALCR